MKHTILIFGFLVSVLVPGCRPRYHSMSQADRQAIWVVDKISDELDLTDAQKTVVNRITGEVLAKRADFKGLYMGAADEVLGQIKSDKIDQDALNVSFQEREQKFKELRLFVIAKFAEFHGTLTPEQRSKLAARLEQYKKHRG